MARNFDDIMAEFDSIANGIKSVDDPEEREIRKMRAMENLNEQLQVLKETQPQIDIRNHLRSLHEVRQDSAVKLKALRVKRTLAQKVSDVVGGVKPAAYPAMSPGLVAGEAVDKAYGLLSNAMKVPGELSSFVTEPMPKANQQAQFETWQNPQMKPDVRALALMRFLGSRKTADEMTLGDIPYQSVAGAANLLTGIPAWLAGASDTLKSGVQEMMGGEPEPGAMTVGQHARGLVEPFVQAYRGARSVAGMGTPEENVAGARMLAEQPENPAMALLLGAGAARGVRGVGRGVVNLGRNFMDWRERPGTTTEGNADSQPAPTGEPPTVAPQPGTPPVDESAPAPTGEAPPAGAAVSAPSEVLQIKQRLSTNPTTIATKAMHQGKRPPLVQNAEAALDKIEEQRVAGAIPDEMAEAAAQEVVRGLKLDPKVSGVILKKVAPATTSGAPKQPAAAPSAAPQEIDPLLAARSLRLRMRQQGGSQIPIGPVVERAGEVIDQLVLRNIGRMRERFGKSEEGTFDPFGLASKAAQAGARGWRALFGAGRQGPASSTTSQKTGAPRSRNDTKIGNQYTVPEYLTGIATWEKPEVKPYLTNPLEQDIDAEVLKNRKPDLLDYLLKPTTSPGSFLGPSTATMAKTGARTKGLLGEIRPGTGIAPAANLAKERVGWLADEIKKDVEGKEPTKFSREEDIRMGNIIQNKATIGDVKWYDSRPDAQGFVTRLQEMFWRVAQEALKNDGIIKGQLGKLDYLPHVSKQGGLNFKEIMQKFEDNTLHDLTFSPEERHAFLHFKRMNEEGKPVGATEALKAYVRPLAKEIVWDPTQRVIEARVEARQYPTGPHINPDAARSIAQNFVRYSVQGRANAIENALTHTWGLNHASAGLLWTLENMFRQSVDYRKPLDSIVRASNNFASFVLPEPLRVFVAHSTGDLITKIMEYKTNPADPIIKQILQSYGGGAVDFMKGAINRASAMLNANPEQFARWKRNGIIRGFWDMSNPEDPFHGLSLLGRAQGILTMLADDGSKTMTFDRAYARFIKEGYSPNEAEALASSVTWEMNNYSQMTHMPAGYGTAGAVGNAALLFKRPIIRQWSNINKWMWTADAQQWLRGLGIVGAMMMLRSQGADFFRRWHLVPNFGISGYSGPDSNTLHGALREHITQYGALSNLFDPSQRAHWLLKRLDRPEGERDWFGLQTQTPEVKAENRAYQGQARKIRNLEYAPQRQEKRVRDKIERAGG